MSEEYNFQNMTSGRIFRCASRLWISALNRAREEGWEPEGTRYDFEFQIEEICDHMYDQAYNLFLMYSLHMEHINWNGNYTDRENQIVSVNDTHELLRALQGSETDDNLIQFLKEGSFRICRNRV